MFNKIITSMILAIFSPVSLEILSRNTGKSIEELSKDSDRMSYLNPQEALDYGVIDRILTSQKDLSNNI